MVWIASVGTFKEQMNQDRKAVANSAFFAYFRIHILSHTTESIKTGSCFRPKYKYPTTLNEKYVYF